ncbi:lipase 3-like [Nylanderia fulva]|uniref:lipase 3-like n=1 Tax=Nylanderia fulva TaxID=613905 RepID=UPI0010FB27DC|nr:lipase 3-like [Nylanderia fulva]
MATERPEIAQLVQMMINFGPSVFLDHMNLGKEICVHLMFMTWGYDWEQFNYTLLSDIMTHLPGGGSSNTVTHYSQGFQSGKFCQYDYGCAKNLLIYNSVEPPDYDLSKIMVSIALFYGPGDTLVDIVT